MTEVANSGTRLETIDYKPSPAKPESNYSLDPDEKKTTDEDHDDDDAHFDMYSEETEWDEGGKSHCGYSEAVHSTLMSVGESVHKIIGEPSPHVESELKAVGNWFQEASYAARDLFRGPKEGEESSGMQEDAYDAVKTLLRGGGSKDKKDSENAADDDQKQDPPSTTQADF